ncbi:hypothetical protein QQZ08_002640 [Neonectria magnoliae]|uniref:Homeobox domain-containing protein n=1 Tax=Neonectria magnoliae TaxID=2732573 RepID=A0ABR1IBY9_9HYPO
MADTSPIASFAALPDQHAGSSSARHDESFTPQTLPPLASAAHNTRPASETEKHPKGKRKRTAAKDKMILEEAYSNNPKPDKQARLEIVQRVSLNEKEVQIWFQNRRQNDRRKSRPLSAQEIAALRYGGMHVITSDPITNRTPSKPDKTFPASDPASSRITDPTTASPRPLAQTPSISRSHSDIIFSTPLPASQDGMPRSYPDVTPKHDDPSPSHESHDGSHSLSASMSSSVGYLANRWNLGSSFSTPSTLGRGGDDSFKLEPFPPSSCSSEPPQPSSQSKVRLSLSLEGKAELVSNHQMSPTRNAPSRPSSTTPPTLPHVRQRSLQRSHSALPSITLPPISTLTNSLPPRLMRGRSRDVHAWESCADAEKRDELTAQAEHESNGSAIAAISLLRSSSGVLQPSSGKRNAPISKPQRPHSAKKAKLNRSGSSIARVDMDAQELEKPEKEYGKVKVSMLVSPSGDSDKENWSPDEDGNTVESQHRRPLPPVPPKALNPRRLGRVLQEHKGPNLLGNRSNTAPARHRSLVKEGVEIFEDAIKRPAEPRDDDVERFMRGGEVSPSKKPDMDCVAGLLSLSQGAWR